jgi:hypothetical protein
VGECGLYSSCSQYGPVADSWEHDNLFWGSKNGGDFLSSCSMLRYQEGLCSIE